MTCHHRPRTLPPPHVIVLTSLLMMMMTAMSSGQDAGGGGYYRSRPLLNLLEKKKPIIEAPSGRYMGKVVGLDSTSLDPVVQFLGIPYAQTITPEKRWTYAAKIDKPMQSLYEATKFRPACPQPEPKKERELPVWLRKNCNVVKQMINSMSEDCLYLNIYVPGKYFQANNTNFLSLNLPVMLYFHGHTFSDGSGNLYDGSVLSSLGNVIVVTFNYRLGVLGFMSTQTEAVKGNFGLYDQILANDWLIANVQSFGGDVEKITAFGSGAGGTSIGLLMLSPQAEGKFKRAILQSGSPLNPDALTPDPARSFRAFANSSRINCNRNSTALILQCLKRKSWRELVEAAGVLNQGWKFGPVVDGTLLLGQPRRLMEEKEFINYEVIVGVTSDDGFRFLQERMKLSPNETCNMRNGFTDSNIYDQETFVGDLVNFVSSLFDDDNYTDFIRDTIRFLYTDWNKQVGKDTWRKAICDIYTDQKVLLPAIQTAEFHSFGANPTYFYTFDQNPGNGPGRDWLGAISGEELPYIFGAPLLEGGMPLFPYSFNKNDQMLSAALITYWANFAENGDPNVGREQGTDFNTGNPNTFTEQWPQYHNDTKKYLKILYKPQVSEYYRSSKMAFWRSFVPGLKKKKKSQRSCEDPKQTQQQPSTGNDFYNNGDMPNDEPTPSNCTDKKQTDTLCRIVAISIAVFLFCVSAVIFALMSYQKDKHRFQLEKLRTDLKSNQKHHHAGSGGKSEGGGSSHHHHHHHRSSSSGGGSSKRSKIIEEKSDKILLHSSGGKHKGASSSGSGVPLPLAAAAASEMNDPAHPKTLPMKSCLKVGGSGGGGVHKSPSDYCKSLRVGKVVTSPSNLSAQTLHHVTSSSSGGGGGGHANTLRSQMISTERFAELEGIRCITLGRRRCNSALASTLLKQNDHEPPPPVALHHHHHNNNTTAKPTFHEPKMPAPPVQFTQAPARGNELLAYKPLDGSVRSLTLNRSGNYRVGHGAGPYGTVHTTQRPFFQSQMAVGQPGAAVMESTCDRKPLICRTRPVLEQPQPSFGTLPMPSDDLLTGAATPTNNS